jgi:hypothetical protein
MRCFFAAFAPAGGACGRRCPGRQYRPFCDPKALALFDKFEKALYAGLA